MMRIETRIIDIDSSHISRLEYVWHSDDDWALNNCGHVRATFQNGIRYIYEEVPFIVLMNVAASESVGQAFNTLIKGGNYSYYKEGESVDGK